MRLSLEDLITSSMLFIDREASLDVLLVLVLSHPEFAPMDSARQSAPAATHVLRRALFMDPDDVFWQKHLPGKLSKAGVSSSMTLRYY